MFWNPRFRIFKMAYQFDFGAVFDYTPVLVTGIEVTIELTVAGGILGMLVAIFCAWVRTDGPTWLRPIVGLYVEVIRNTPFLIQLFFIFFGLPARGIRINEMEAAILAMVINLGAYNTEIIRAGIAAIPRGQREAAASLAMSRGQAFRYIILQPALQKMWPALSSQLVIVMLGSAVCSTIAVTELSFAANFIQGRNFRSFESYAITTVIYLVLAIVLRQILRYIGDRYVVNRRPRSVPFPGGRA